MSDDDNDRWRLEPFRFSDSRPAAEDPEPEAEPAPAPRRAPFGKETPGKAKKVKPPEPARAPKVRKERVRKERVRKERPIADGSGWDRFKAGVAQLKWLWITLLVLFVLGAAAALGGGVYVWRKYLTDVPPLPDRAALFAVNRAPGIKFLDREGALIATRGPRYGERITLSQLPEHVPQAFLAAEDRRFYQHGALDLYGIGRAAVVNWRAGHTVQGGSTITQQLAKGLFLTPEQTIKRKLHEAVMARRLYKVLSRDEILELYLNRIYFGANTFGIDGASMSYFGKPARELTIAEAALLASLPKAPSRLALNKNMGAALQRSHLVLDRMRKEGWITAEQEQLALDEPPKLQAKALQAEGDIGYILDYATNEAVKIAGANAPDLTVKLTIDSKLQKVGADTVRKVLSTDGKRAKARQAALLSLGGDGAIRAMVGGTDFDVAPFNRAVQAKRQPGSTFKPFVYAAALEKGLLPKDVRVDGPVKFGDWAPENYGGNYSGPVTIETALAKSINTVAVKVGQEVGGPAIGEISRRFGFTTIPARPDLSVSLGSYEVNLLELTSAFQVFQQAGQRVQPYIIESIVTQDGAPVYSRSQRPGSPVYDIQYASMMVKMLKGVVERGTGTRAAFGRPAAGKTGTSQNYRDAWFIGFTPDIVTGVWVGNDDDTPMERVAGGGMPSTIWRQYMVAAHAGLPAKDFDWLLPDIEPETEPDPRNGFYEGLGSDFSRSAGELEILTREPDPVVEPPPGQAPPGASAPPAPSEPIPY
ncbi:MAG: PBP1A family penicillin-binding protein [Caulobacteraceae bacterium]|nr:MAG: PBP1A family penicillin-binding protein [Caulobacteraceae bacterium]